MFLDRAGVVAKDRYENRVGLIENAPMRAGNDRNARGRNKGRVEAAIVKQRFGEIVQRRARGKFTVFRKAFQKLRWQPAIRTVPPYHDDPAYIEGLAASVKNHLATLDWEPEMLITSFHGIPQSYFKKGDPYYCHCQKTARLLRQALGRTDKNFMITFQSRFGPEEWLQPYTDKTMEKLASEGFKRIAVMNPGFVSDCLETLEEIAGEAGEIFLHHGGEKFTHIPCLNDSAEGMNVLEEVVRRELQGWV